MPVFPKELKFVNHSFEDSVLLSGWSFNKTSLGSNPQNYDYDSNSSHLLPYVDEGTKGITFITSGSAISTLSQILTIPASAYSSIDAGNVKLETNISFISKNNLTTRAFPHNEFDDISTSKAVIEIEFYDNSLSLISNTSSLPQSFPQLVLFLSAVNVVSSNPTNYVWNTLSFSNNVPPNTRSMKISFVVYSNNNTVYFLDNAKAALYEQENIGVDVNLDYLIGEALVDIVEENNIILTNFGFEVLSPVSETLPVASKPTIIIGNTRFVVKGRVIIAGI